MEPLSIRARIERYMCHWRHENLYWNKNYYAVMLILKHWDNWELSDHDTINIAWRHLKAIYGFMFSAYFPYWYDEETTDEENVNALWEAFMIDYSIEE